MSVSAERLNSNSTGLFLKVWVSNVDSTTSTCYSSWQNSCDGMHCAVLCSWHPGFKIVDGEGFKIVAEKLIHMGAKYGNIPASELLPSAWTLSRHIDYMCCKERDSLIRALTETDRFGVTTDMWTHEDTSTPHITVMLHYITKEKKSCIAHYR